MALKQIVDIVKEIVSACTFDVAIASVNGYVITTTNTYYLTKGNKITIGGNDYVVTNVVFNAEITVKPINHSNIITASTFTLLAPKFFHGTITSTDKEIILDSQKTDNIYPIIYLYENLTENIVNDKNNPIERESPIKLYLLDISNYDDNLNKDFLDDVLKPLSNLEEKLIEEIEKHSHVKNIDTNWKRTNIPRFARLNDNGEVNLIFSEELTGLSLSLTLMINKVKKKCNTPFTPPTPVCSPVEITKSNGGLITLAPSGATIPINDSMVSNSDGSYTANVLATDNLQLPDITFIDSNGSISQVPAVTDIIATPITPCQDVSITNSDGSYSESVVSGGNLTLPNSVIEVNGELFNNLPATNSLDISVVNENGEDVGTITNNKVLVTDDWIRNPEWLQITEPQSDSFIGLLAVFPNGRNDLTMRFSATGGYTVNYGDGTITTHGSNTISTHTYDYNTISNSTLTTDGYKQVIVTVTPTTVSNSFTGLLAYSYANNMPINWLDIVLYAPNITRLYGSATVIHNLLERFRITGITPSADFQYLFFRAPKIQVVEIDYSKPINLFVFFGYCGIKKIGDINVACQNTPNFYNSKALVSVGNYIYNGTQFNANNDSSIVRIGDVTCPNVNVSKTSLKNSKNLAKMGFMYFPVCLDASEMFRANSSLEKFIGNFDSVLNIRYMFEGCTSLREVSFSDLSNVTSISALFSKCYALSSLRVPNIQTTFSLVNCSLDRLALIQVFNDLANASMTLTITGNNGVANLTPSDLLIATNKGWTIIQ